MKPTPNRPDRTRDLRLRVTEAEKRAVQRLARDERLSVSDLIRERLGLPLAVETDPTTTSG